MSSDDEDAMDIERVTKVAKVEESAAPDTLPWVEKYRPKELTDLISHHQILDTITKLINGGKMPHFLFYGPPGTGKTSTILAVARKLYGKNYSQMILELNASDDRGINVVRDQIKDFANTRSMFTTGLKLVVLDEADAMTQPAQAALRRVIEKYTKTTRFCLICNYLNKLTPAIQSRCTRFRFGPLMTDDVIDRVTQISKLEGVKITEAGLSAVVRLGQGDMRKCLNVLQSAHMGYDKIDEEEIYQCTGQPLPSDIQTIFDTLFNKGFKFAVDKISKLQSTKGLALQDIITELHRKILKVEFSEEVKMILIDKLADIEHRLAAGTSEKLNLGALVGAFQLAREQISKESK
ncbi:replication factor C subunit 5-like [Planoprotostelium fungivorum]|uniref:Replication factor C subunit 5-like n=1 Tax=Planoprotostelium fungivorum TaxID=1890364 RepID=A0A2P6NXL0_9EUKA|nr:replication factor C subunit 5-like [Planoprotostelium fungivorum]